MNDRWKKNDARWQKPERIRIARRFRHHVRTPWNPQGRIHREPCWFCLQEKRKEPAFDPAWLPPGEAHHVDYDHPFVVAWVCHRHHRQVDHGSLTVPQRAIYDYTSLIERAGIGIPRLRRHGPMKRRRARRASSGVPF